MGTNLDEKKEKNFLTLDEVKQESLEILKVFDAFCRRHDLRYSLAGGTLLGAVRHKGFIPWDDDIDVMMPRPDYERLLELRRDWFDETGFSVLGYPDASSQNSAFVKLSNGSIIVKEAAANRVSHLGIDIFPIDGLPIDDDEVKQIYSIADKYRKPILAIYASPDRATSFAKRIGKVMLRLGSEVFPLLQYAEQRLMKHSRCYSFDEAPRAGSIAWGLYGIKECFPRDLFEKYTDLQFEDARFSVIANWDMYLTSLFGYYIKLPSEEDRVNHEIIAWRSIEDPKEVK